MSTMAFARQPLSPPPVSPSALSSAVVSENESTHGLKQPGPTSLLSAMINSPNHRTSQSRPQPSSAGLTTSASSALSSPHSIPDPILRRSSVTSASGHGEPHAHLSLLEALDGVSTKLGLVARGDAADKPRTSRRRCSLKFEVAPVTKGSDLNHHADHPPLDTIVPADDSDSDDGYMDDLDEGSDSSAESSTEFPFARPTHYGPRRSPTPSPPVSGAISPPPPRRGRGHIRVAEDTNVSDERCSRHRSPPPRTSASRERRGSRGRLSDAGPRLGRAGSPMPSKVFTSSDEEEPTKPSHPQRGWLSDDYGMRKHPAHPPVPHISTSARQDPAAHSVPMARSQSLAEQGVRGFLRRASEHIPGFKRSDPAPPPENDKTTGSVPLVAQSTCPPQVDATPATASSHVNSTDLVHQLELTLSLGRPVDLARSRSLGAKVSFKDPAGGRGHEMRSHG